MLDPNWQRGYYYGTGRYPRTGVKLARWVYMHKTVNYLIYIDIPVIVTVFKLSIIGSRYQEHSVWCNS